MITAAAHAEWVAHAVAEYPREACGVVVRTAQGEEYVPCVNRAENAGAHFRLSGDEYADAEDRGEVLALMHSHPNGAPMASDGDRVACEETGVPWGITALGGSPLTVLDTVWLEPTGYRAPLVGRHFLHGVLDCYSIVRDCFRYPREELEAIGITDWPFEPVMLPDFPREDKWWERGEDLYRAHFAEAGFEPVTGALQTGDVIIMQIGRDEVTRKPVAVPNHAAVYMGQGRMLHHPYGRLSERVVYGGQWQDRTRLIVRYRT